MLVAVYITNSKTLINVVHAVMYYQTACNAHLLLSAEFVNLILHFYQMEFAKNKYQTAYNIINLNLLFVVNVIQTTFSLKIKHYVNLLAL